MQNSDEEVEVQKIAKELTPNSEANIRQLHKALGPLHPPSTRLVARTVMLVRLVRKRRRLQGGALYLAALERRWRRCADEIPYTVKENLRAGKRKLNKEKAPEVKAAVLVPIKRAKSRLERLVKVAAAFVRRMDEMTTITWGRLAERRQRARPANTPRGDRRPLAGHGEVVVMHLHGKQAGWHA